MLTDTAIQKARAAGRARKITDRDGLYLLIRPDGAKYWRFDYRHQGKRKTISLGIYPDVGLGSARDRVRAAREHVAHGRDPSDVRKAERRRLHEHGRNTFAAVAREWLAKQKGTLAKRTYDKKAWMLDAFLIPALGSTPIAEVEPPAILKALRHIEARGTHETAHRTKQACSQVFRHAVATGRATRDATADLKGALEPVVTTHHAAVTAPAQIGALLRAIDTFDGSFSVLTALQLAPLVFVRPGELRQAEWRELDLDGATWRIPAARMKMREEHLVPLATQAVTLLRELRPLTGAGRFLFPSNRTSLRPMSNNTITAALRRLGYDKSEMTGHGFRTTAATRLNELGWAPDLIERQLAHQEQNAVRDAYNRATHLDERRRMMQAWADELDRLRANLVPMHRAG